MEFEEVEINSERWLNLENLLNEEWRDIKGYEGLYQISNYGRTRALEIKLNCNLKYNRIRTKKALIKKNNFDKDGYCSVTLFNKKYHKKMRVHRLVGLAFIPNPENKPIINHIDGIKNNNILYNLEWCTNSENDLHAYRIGLRTVNKTGTGKFGKLNGSSKPIYMIDKDTNKIIKKFDALADAARYLGRNPNWMSHISQQIRGERKTAYGYKWRYVNAKS